MTLDDKVVEYVAEKALIDFKMGSLDDTLASIFARRPWIDVIRQTADESCLDRVESVLNEPNTHSGQANLALNIARGIDCSKIDSSIWNIFKINVTS